MALSLRPLNPDLYPPGVFQIPPEAGDYRVGRDSGNDLQVFHPSVSSQHALLEVSGNDGVGVIEVVDCGSSNGTFVNGNRVVDRQVIASGDILCFATAEFRVVAVGEFTGEDVSFPDDSTRPVATRSDTVDHEALRTLAEEDRDRLAAEVGTITGEREQLRTLLAVGEAEIAAKDEEIAALQSAYEAEIAAKNGEIAALQSAYEAEIAAKDGDIAALQGANEAFADLVAEHEESLRALNREIEEAAQREQRLQTLLSESRNAVMERESNIAALNYEISRRDNSLRQLGEQHEGLQRAHDETLAAHAALQGEMEIRMAELAGAIGAKDFAEATASGIVARHFELSSRLLGDWQAWFRDEGQGDGSADPEVAFARVEAVATRIRSELDLIEPIWHQFGEGVQDELRRRCDRLREEGAELLTETEARRVELAHVLENLEEFRNLVDVEVRRVQGLSRRGTEIEIPERFESMVIARDREQELYRSLIERLEVLDRFLAGYRGSRKLKEVVIELDEFRARLAAILESSGVQIFEVPVHTMLTLKHRKEVQILSRKGWGTRQYTEYPFQPGEVIKVIRPGYRVGEGEYAVILRKVEVLIRGVDE